VRVPPAGSTPVALRVTAEALATGLAGDDVALTVGGLVTGAAATGTVTDAVAGVVEFAPPTLTWKVRLVWAERLGATNVACTLLGFVRVTAGPPVCVHAKGPLLGVLPVASRVTVVPVATGPGEGENAATAVAEGGGGVPPAVQLTAGAVASGQGFNCPMNWFAAPFQGPEPLRRKVRSPKFEGTGGVPIPRFSGKMNVKLGAWYCPVIMFKTEFTTAGMPPLTRTPTEREGGRKSPPAGRQRQRPITAPVGGPGSTKKLDTQGVRAVAFPVPQSMSMA
jgi:hypothetical protein